MTAIGNPQPATGNSKRVDGACLLALLVFAVAVCSPVISGRVPVATDTLSLWGPAALTDRVPVHNPDLADSALQYLPAQVFVRRSLAGGEWPLWNPDLFSGYPFLATDENQLYYPVAWLLLSLPLSLAIQVSAIFHIWLAGAGMYVLARVLGAGRAGSLLSGLAFAGSGQLYTAIEITGIADIYGWLPWILAASEMAWRRRSWAWAAVAGLFSGVMAVSGHLPWYMYGGVFLFLWLAARMSTEAIRWLGARRMQSEKQRRDESPSGAAAPPSGRYLWGHLGRSIAILAWGPALAAIHLLPFLEMVTLSSRIKAAGIPATPGGLANTVSLLGNQLTIFVPQLLGTSAGSVGSPLTFNSCWYIGIAPLMLACVALVLRRERSVLFLGAVGLGAFGVAAGLPLFNALSDLPGLQTQIPGRIAYLFIFCMAALAGLGLDAAIDAAARRPRIWAVISGLTVCSGLVVAYLVLEKHNQSSAQPALYELQSAAVRQAAIIAGALLLWLVAILVLCSGRRYRAGTASSRPDWRDRWGRAAAGGLLVALAAADLLTYAPGYNTYVMPDTLLPRSEVADVLRSNNGLWRLIAPDAPNIMFPPNSSVLYGLHDVQGYDSLHFNRYEEFWAAIDKTAAGTVSNYYNVGLRPQSYMSAQARLLNAQYVTTYFPLAEVGQTDRSLDLGELTNNPLAQSFEAPGPLSSVEVEFDTAGRVNHAPVILHVRRTLADTQDMVTETADPSGWKGRLWVSFKFPTLQVTQGEKLVLMLDTQANTPGDSVHVLGSKGSYYRVGQLHQGGKWRKRSIAFVARAELPGGLKKAYEDRYVGVYTNTLALARVFVVGAAQVASATGVLALMGSKNFDPSTAVLIEQSPPPGFNTQAQGAITPGESSAGTARVTSYRNLNVAIEADMSRPGWLVLGDVNYPGWHVSVDGREAPLYTAYYIVRAVPLGVGIHTVHFYFLPATLVAGGTISALALTMVLFVMVWRVSRRSRSG